jgi:hypothetical protein
MDICVWVGKYPESIVLKQYIIILVCTVATFIFHWRNPSGRKMALGSTQPLTEMSTLNVFWGMKAAGE